MKLNAKSEYALRVMVDLAGRPGEQTTLDQIAARQYLPPTILPNIVQTLARAGLVETVRGYGGGVRLERPAKEINVRMVLEAVEGPLRLYRCHAAKGDCPLGLGRRCRLRALWERTGRQMLGVWEQTSLADLADGARKSTRGGSARRRATHAHPI